MLELHKPNHLALAVAKLAATAAAAVIALAAIHAIDEWDCAARPLARATIR